jgi:Cft2 family RNA processing exonuclease
MKIHFIGGAHEVGGSCSVVEVGARRLLVDCGQRMGGGDIDRLPDLARVQELGPIDAILVTHAHADHIGALPLIHLAYPQAPLYTTEATLALMKIMLADSLRIMQARWLQEAEIPLYPEHAVLSMLARVKVVPLGQLLPLCQGEMQMTFLLSGHVLGACSLTLDTAEGRVLFTGDYSVDPQRTVDPFVVPKIRPHVVITEATYGNRLHANRKAEESRLAQAVAEVVANGGKVLIPAFALGRAQEVLLILIHEQKVGRIPRFPIFVDGMVRNICQTYSLFPEFLGQRLRKQVEREGNPFFYEGSPAQVVDNKKRESVPLGEPCCIVSSSGMLTGGPSQFYAAELASNPKNAIFITGYQDEESPGGKILALADQVQPIMRLMDRQVTLLCKIAKYNLSAHADAVQISSLMATLGPRRCYLVHGDDGARQALTAMMPPSLSVCLPRNGEMAEFTFASTVKAPVQVCSAPLELAQLREQLLRQGAAEQTFTLEELAGQLYGSPTPEQLQDVTRQLATTPGFQADPRRPQLFRLLPETPRPTAPRWKKETQDPNNPLEQARKALKLVPDILHLGYRPDTRELIVSVAFPALFEKGQAQLLSDLHQRLNVKVLVQAKDTPRQLAEIARKHLPLGARLSKAPSIYPDGRVVLKVRFSDSDEATRQAYLEKVTRDTGHLIELCELEAAPPPPREVITADGRMELNSAYRLVCETLRERGLTVFRCGRKTQPEEHLEVGLLAPWLLEKHASEVARLEAETGYPIRAAGVNQPAIEKLLRQSLPPAWQFTQQPRFFLDRRRVGIRLPRRPDPEAVEAVSRAFFEQVGLHLEILGP